MHMFVILPSGEVHGLCSINHAFNRTFRHHSLPFLCKFSVLGQSLPVYLHSPIRMDSSSQKEINFCGVCIPVICMCHMIDVVVVLVLSRFSNRKLGSCQSSTIFIDSC